MKFVAVVGSRDYENMVHVRTALWNVVAELGGRENVTIVSGGAKGADHCGERWARENNVPCVVYRANWDVFGKAAGPMRNQQMVDCLRNNDGFVVAFWDGESKGTRDMLERCIKAGIDGIIDINGETKTIAELKVEMEDDEAKRFLEECYAAYGMEDDEFQEFIDCDGYHTPQNGIAISTEAKRLLKEADVRWEEKVETMSHDDIVDGLHGDTLTEHLLDGGYDRFFGRDLEDDIFTKMSNREVSIEDEDDEDFTEGGVYHKVGDNIRVNGYFGSRYERIPWRKDNSKHSADCDCPLCNPLAYVG